MRTKVGDNERLVKSHAPNTYFRLHKTQDLNKNPVVHNKLDDILEALHKCRMKWEFIGSKYITSRYECIEFAVYENNEYLGVFGYNAWNTNEKSYYVDCRSLAKHRQRGNETVTDDAKRLVKIVRDHFAPRSAVELVNDAHKRLRDAMQAEHRKHEVAHQRLWGEVSKQLLAKAMDNWEVFSKYTDKHGDKQFQEELTTSYRKRKEAYNLMHTGSNGQKKYDVILRGSDYIVSASDPSEPSERHSIFSEETLPDSIKVPLTFLKLREPNTLIADVGYRTSDTEFFIVGDDK